MGIKEVLRVRISGKEARISVLGLGYVGLPTAVFFGEQGFRVTGADVDARKVELLAGGRSPSPELNLDGRVGSLLNSGMLQVTTDISGAVSGADVVLIIVPTPVTRMKRPDMSYVVSAAKDTARGLKRGQLVVLESTTFPGTCEEVLQPILEESGLVAGDDFGLVYCPERYNPGDDLHTLDRVSRIVGGIDREWADIARDLYQSIIREPVTTVKDLKTAEAAKIIENTQRDLNIALVNELALIFERMGIDVVDVLDGASTKWNFHRYLPGPGVGGHCLPVDPYYLTAKAEELGYHPRVILAGRAINDHMPEHLFEVISDTLNEFECAVKGSRIVLLGFSYKRNVGDARETPAIPLARRLGDKGAEVVIVDPYVDAKEVEAYGRLVRDVYDAMQGADAVVIVTNHSEFDGLDWGRVRDMVRRPIIIDGRRSVSPDMAEGLGFRYRGIGRG